MGICLSSTTMLRPSASGISLPDELFEETVGDGSGNCGANTTWKLQGGTLVISGNGTMADWENVLYTPWYSNMSEIRSVVINEGVTSIGRAAFYGASNLTSVTIPSTVTTISSSAFESSGINSVTLPVSVATVGSYAFYNCPNLREVKVYNVKCDFVSGASCITNSKSNTFGGTIYGGENSTAKNIANSLHCNFVVLNDIPKTTAAATTTTTTTTTVKTTVTTTKATTKATTAKPAATTTKATTAKVTTTKAATTTKATTTTQNPWQWGWNWGWPPQTTQPAPTIYGDANCDKDVNIADSVLIMQSISNPSKYDINGSDSGHITEKGKDSADVHQRGNGITNGDALVIQKYKLGLLSSLPE